MSNRRIQTVAVAGAAAVSASLIGFAALSQSPGPAPQTRAVALTAGDAEIFLPDLSTFDPTVASGYPPLLDVLQGAEQWSLSNSPGEIVNLDGNDTQTTIGSFVNNDFLERGGVEGGAGAGVPLPYAGSEIDLMNFGGGFQSEWVNFVDASGGHTITDTFITPFGNYTIPLGSTPPPESGDISVAAAVPAAADALTGLEASIQFNTSAAETAFSLAQTAFADGEYPLALSQALDGFNNLTVGVANDLLVNGYIGLTGGTEYAEFIFQNPGQPVDLAAAFDSAQTLLSQAQGLVNDALSDFGAGNTVSALTDLAGIGTDSTYATDAIILGLFDSLTGGAGLSAEAAAVPAAADGYSFTELIESIQNTTAAGEHLFTLAEASFADGDYSVGLSDALAGFDALTNGVGSDLVVNGYSALIGDDGNAGFTVEIISRPADFSSALTEAQGFLADVHTTFTDALTSFASGDVYSGLVELSDAGFDSSYATDAIILGLADSLPGFTPSI